MTITAGGKVSRPATGLYPAPNMITNSMIRNGIVRNRAIGI
jgi:hypothetical protein